MQDNFEIFIENLSIYHIIFDIITVLTFLGTVWFCWAYSHTIDNPTTKELPKEQKNMDQPLLGTNIHDEQEHDNEYEKRNIVSDYMENKRFLYKKLSSRLSKEELEEEQKMEREQLAKIFELLQQQKDTFEMNSMEQVQDQLHLYGI